MHIRFTVNGRPPKKHGEKSMWARDDEAPRIVSLREKALEVRTKLGINDCFRTLVSLELRIFVPKSRLESIGDLDNFITGVCDGLQAADSKVLPYLNRVFSEPRREGIDPKKALVIENDSKVVSILAKKIELDEGKEEYYDVVVETG